MPRSSRFLLLAEPGLVFYLRDRTTGRWTTLAGESGAWDGLRWRLASAETGGGRARTWRLSLAEDVPRAGGAPREVEVTTAGEVVLNDAGAHEAHPAFAKLFLQTAWEPGASALLVRRRPRDGAEHIPWLVHAALDGGEVEFETDRARFAGRGRPASRPAALAAPGPLSGTAGNVLDPVVCLRRRLALDGASEVAASFLLGSAPSREEALALVAAAGGRPATAAPPATSREATAPAREATAPAREARGAAPAFANGIGAFTADGREYVIRVERADDGSLVLPPRPWVNVIANEEFGCLVSETGAGCTWHGNSREHRLTPWSNDPVLDPHGDTLLLRDEDSGAERSCWPGPRPGRGPYEVRHGFGYTRCAHEDDGLAVDVLLFVARRDPVRVTRAQVRNTGARERHLSLRAFTPLVLGGAADDAAAVCARAGSGGLLLATRPAAGPWADAAAFAAAACPDPGVTIAARVEGANAGTAFDQRATFTLGPGATVEVVLLLGETDGEEAARALAGALAAPGAAARAFAEARDFWRDGLGALRVRTPSPALDHLVNGWLGYQTASCRLWGRTAFYQSGGAFGFRDQLQDALALLPLWPDLARRQIVLHAAHQFVEGDVLHWWHPPLSRGLRTRFADDLLWLPLLAAEYVATTGDASVLAERARYLAARPLAPGEDEAYLAPDDSGEAADVYDHCCRAIDRSLATGAHGLPLFGCGDWNDGMNRVGREGRGESVWMGFFLVAVIDAFAPLADARGDRARAARYRAHRERLARALDAAGWDGGWYLRGFYDDGAPLGSHRDDECRIDALVQAWSVLSGVASPARAAQALDAVERHLVDEEAGLIRLLTPPFVDTPRDPGYIKGYVAGVRENGGQYTHAAAWVVRAMAEAGRRERAAALLDLVNPILHADSPAAVARYQVEPYVVAADVYGAAPHVGRGGWTWYTGSSGWLLRVALESVFGVRREGGDTLVVAPRVPDAWPGFAVRWRVPGPGAVVDLAVSNPDGCAQAVVAATVDGVAAPCPGGVLRVALRPGGEHRVEARLGRAREGS